MFFRCFRLDEPRCSLAIQFAHVRAPFDLCALTGDANSPIPPDSRPTRPQYLFCVFVVTRLICAVVLLCVLFFLSCSNLLALSSSFQELRARKALLLKSLEETGGIISDEMYSIMEELALVNPSSGCGAGSDKGKSHYCAMLRGGGPV